MKKIERSKLIKTILLLISTIPFPLFFAILLYVVPALYICFIVPYLIWKIWFGKTDFKIRRYLLIWKIPIIILLALAMFFVEMGLIFIFAISTALIYRITIVILLLLILRCVTYAMMIFIWQSDILKPYRKLIHTAIMVYCVTVLYFAYSVINAPDTDDYSVPFSEYISSKIL